MAVDGDGAEVAAPVTGPSSFEALREPVTAVVRECLDARLKESDDYSGKRMQEAASEIPSACAKALHAMTQDFKFVVSCQIIPKLPGSYGIHASNACVWDNAVDGQVSTRWESPAVLALVSVFCVSRE